LSNQQIVSIDLGSAYTKIAVRNNWDLESYLVRDTGLATVEVAHCIPSVVAKVSRQGTARWQIGLEAAQQIPGPGVEIFRNWKAGLFGKASEVASAEEVAVHFFDELKRKLMESTPLKSIPTLPVRLCIPKLGDTPRVEALLRTILETAGWKPCANRPIVFEPESNVLGLVTRGMNKTGFQNSPTRRIQFQAMLETGPVQAAFRNTHEGGYGVCVLDIGAFTTDFAYLRFDTDHSSADWTQPHLVQNSAEIGIRSLTSSILENIEPEVRDRIIALSSGQQDRIMADLYQGNEAELVNPRGGRIRIGGPRHAALVTETVRDFAHRIWQARERFHRTSVDHPIHPEYVTGGGSMIPDLSAFLEEKKRTEYKTTAPGAKCYTTDELLNPREIREERKRETYAARSAQLRRGGSALGGCSVFFEFGTPSLGSPYPPSFRGRVSRA
jgi:hypothetical protein